MKSSLFDLVLFVVLASVTSGFAKNTGETFFALLEQVLAFLFLYMCGIGKMQNLNSENISLGQI